MTNKSIIPLLLIAILAQGETVRAQDAHYWDNQYGAKAELLGGLVVGSPTDLSSTFYNPGWIALQKGPSLLLTTRAAEYYNITFKEGLGKGSEPTSSVVTPSPGYLAGRFSLGDDLGWKWAYTYLQKVKFEYNAGGLRIDQNLAPEADQDQWFSGEAFRDMRVSENWYGVSLSRKLTDNVALGFSPYVAHRSQHSRSQVMGLGLDANDVYSNAFLIDEYNYWNVRMLLKMGVAAERERWSAGLALTTPSLGLLGDGDVYQSASFSGDYLPDQPGIDPPYLQANHQQGLAVKWKSPLSIAAGCAVALGQTRVYLTVEWFDAIDRYNVLDAEAYEIQSMPGNFVSYELEYAANNVVNVGFGVAQTFNDKFSLYTSYRTDSSITPDELSNDISMTVWDLNHLTAGAAFHFMRMEFTAGLQFSWGDDQVERFLSFDQSENGDINGSLGNRDVDYRRVKALLGFNLPFSAPGL